MRGFLTAILLSGLAGVLFANCSNSPLLTDGPAMMPHAMAEADADRDADAVGCAPDWRRAPWPKHRPHRGPSGDGTQASEPKLYTKR